MRRLLSLALVGISAGCGRAAIRPAPTAQIPSVARQALAQAAPGPPVAAPLPKPERPATEPPPEAVTSASPSAPTPLLDAALDRAEDLRSTVVGEITKPTPRPPVFPASATAPVDDAPATPALPTSETAPPPTGPDVSPRPAAEVRPPAPEPITALPDLSPAESLPRPAPALEPSTPSDLPPPVDPEPSAPSAERPEAASRPEIDEGEANNDDVETLAITKMLPCRRVRGFGDVEPWVAPQLRAGHPFILYSELAGVAYETAGGRFRSRVAASAELVLDGASLPAWHQNLGLAEDDSPVRRPDYFVSYVLTLPPTLPPGAYHLRVTQVDEVGGRSASHSIPLAIGR